MLQITKFPKVKLLVFFLLLTSIGSAQQKLPAELNAEIERRINNGLNPGIAVALIDSQQKVHFHNFGLEYEDGNPINEKSTFEIASVSKTFTATLLAKLQEKGHLTFDQKIGTVLSKKLPGSIGKITFHELMNHTSGLPRLPLDFWTSNWDNPYHDYTEERLLADLEKVALDSAKHWSYSNLGYALFGYIMEEFKEEYSLDDLLSEINMGNTFTHSNRKLSTFPHNFGKQVENWDFPGFNKYMGGVKSTSSDMAAYLKYQIRTNPVFAHSYSSPEVVINEADSLFYRKGWLVFHRGGEALIWHNGISGGYNSFIGFNAQTKTGIVILSNAQQSIMDLGLGFLSDSFEIRQPKMPLANEVEKYIQAGQLDQVEKLWSDYDTLSFDKSPMNLYWLQCHYIAVQNGVVALKLNKMLETDFPGDWELYFYRGKIFEMMGDLKDAKACYQEADRLLPGNTFLGEILKSLPGG